MAVILYEPFPSMSQQGYQKFLDAAFLYKIEQNR